MKDVQQQRISTNKLNALVLIKSAASTFLSHMPCGVRTTNPVFDQVFVE
jgi:hypothetical protein